MSDATHYRWQDVPSEAVNPSALRRYVTGERVTVARFELARGGLVPRHAHMNEQVSCVLSGALKFRFDGREMVVRAGEVVQIPGMMNHDVEVLEDSIVIASVGAVRLLGGPATAAADHVHHYAIRHVLDHVDVRAARRFQSEFVTVHPLLHRLRAMEGDAEFVPSTAGDAKADATVKRQGSISVLAIA
jgi:quercetin dioxygenase-like cupin family protein